jgi:HEAT repeat protein
MKEYAGNLTMTDSPKLPERMSPADALPPVEPPSAGFIVQLFIIPAVIVAIIVIVWALFNWLAHMGNDPRSYVEALKRNNEARWQTAHNLAEVLGRSGNEELRKDASVARDLAKLLDDEIEAGSLDDKSIEFRVYLCRVLGEFQVDDVLPTLLKAAKTERDGREVDVRLSALQGLARLIPNLDVSALQRNEALAAVLSSAAQSEVVVMRVHAAYTLGVLGGDAALAQLHVLLRDADADVRVNAATGLARHGDAECVPMLATMIEATDTLLPAETKDETTRRSMQISTQFNALESAAQLAKANPKADLSPITAAIDKLLATNPPLSVRSKVDEVKPLLKR